MGNNDEWPLVFIVGMIIGVLLIPMILLAVGGDADIVNVDGFGELICEDYGLGYSHRTWADKEVGGVHIPVIHCVNESLRLVDSVVVVGGG